MSTFLFFYFLSLFRSRVIQRLRVLFFLFFLRWRRPWLAAEAAVGSQSETAKRKRARARSHRKWLFFSAAASATRGLPKFPSDKKNVIFMFFFHIKNVSFWGFGFVGFFFLLRRWRKRWGEVPARLFFLPTTTEGQKEKKWKTKNNSNERRRRPPSTIRVFFSFFFFLSVWACGNCDPPCVAVDARCHRPFGLGKLAFHCSSQCGFQKKIVSPVGCIETILELFRSFSRSSNYYLQKKWKSTNDLGRSNEIASRNW